MARNDTEFQGALVRLLVGIVVSAILGIGVVLDYFELSIPVYLAFFGYFFALSFAFLAHIFLSRGKPPLRVYCSVLFDITTTTLAVNFTGALSSPAFPLYLWICITNGVRFGHRQMVAAAGTAIVMYNGLLMLRGEWAGHLLHAGAYSVFLAIFPLYLAKLIQALHKAKRDAEAANQAKSDFLANMTHELRTPLVGVNTLSSLLFTTRLDAEQTGYVRTLQESTRLLSSLIEDLLDFSRIEAGRLDLHPQPFAPAQALHGVLEMVRPAAGRPVTLHAEVAEGFPDAVLGDELRFRQVLLNLVGNAVKFTPAGRVVVRAWVVSGDATRVRTRFEVEDTGIGMTAEQLAIVFERFRQGDSSAARSYQGTGLGATIAKRLVELMGGTIGVDSEAGKGTRFWFEIPWPIAMQPLEGPPPAEPAAAVHPGEGAGPILLVEDNAINAAAIAAILRKFGYRVEVAGDAAEALAAAEQIDYALVFMDMQLPGMDGPDLARAWRARPRGASTPIVALTANASTADRAACLAAGMDDFLSKPVETPRLLAVARQYCGEAVTTA
jgi:two-component system sensor histidine kinase RpfC